MLFTGLVVAFAGLLQWLSADDQKKRDRGLAIALVGWLMLMLWQIDARIDQLGKQLTSPGNIQQVGPCDS